MSNEQSRVRCCLHIGWLWLGVLAARGVAGPT